MLIGRTDWATLQRCADIPRTAPLPPDRGSIRFRSFKIEYSALRVCASTRLLGLYFPPRPMALVGRSHGRPRSIRSVVAIWGIKRKFVCFEDCPLPCGRGSEKASVDSKTARHSPKNSAAYDSGSGAAICVAPSLQSAESVRASPQNSGPLLRACAHCHPAAQTAF